MCAQRMIALQDMLESIYLGTYLLLLNLPSTGSFQVGQVPIH